MTSVSMTLALAAAVTFAAAAAIGQLAARAGFPIPNERGRIGHVDGLRGYLALAVMVHHFDIWTNLSRHGAAWGISSAQWLVNLGPSGVALFFITTGLVFYPRIVRGFAAVDWAGTYISRAFRILPLQFATVVVIMILSAILSQGQYRTASQITALIRWMTAYGEVPLLGYGDSELINAKVLWSLKYEWVFYLAVLPLMALLRDLTRDRLPRAALPLILLAVGLVGADWIWEFPVFFFLPLFAFGMIAYEARERERVARLLASGPAAILATALLLAALLFARDPYGLPQMLAYAFFFACVACGNGFGGLFALRGSLVLGECSFGIYLIHGIVLFAMFAFAIPSGLATAWLPALLPVAAIVAVLLSMAAHLAIERPMIRLGQQVAGWRRPRTPRTPAERAVLDVAP